MNFKTTYILFGFLAVVLLLFVFAMWLGPTDTEGTAYVLPSMHKEGSPLEPKDITLVDIVRARLTTEKDGKTETVEKNEKFVFARDPESNRWRVVEPRDYPANSAVIDALVRQIY